MLSFKMSENIEDFQEIRPVSQSFPKTGALYRKTVDQPDYMFYETNI